MAILSETSLDFAREHIERYYDSDFFPKPAEFAAVWHQWDEVKHELLSRNVEKMWVNSPRVMAIQKPKGGFRVVHQLEPLDAIVYTALAHTVVKDVECSRMPVDLNVACSYRFDAHRGSFYAGGSGWPAFEQKTRQLAASYENVLVTDISDFYNQIYLHRLNNAIELANSSLRSIGNDIEKFLSTLNSKSSQGIPVGPAASIVMSEAVLIDVDRYIRDMGLEHTRYVDDFRVFSNSTTELEKALERLTLYLYQHHRLTISSEKTFITKSSKFVLDHIRNTYLEDTQLVVDTLVQFDSYTGDYEEIEVEVHEVIDYRTALVDALQEVLSHQHLDLGLARSVIRTARRRSIDTVALPLVKQMHFFLPVVNDAMLYLHEVTTPTLAQELQLHLEEISRDPALQNQIVRFWFEWYIAQHETLLNSETLRNFVMGGANIENQAQAAITTRNVAWVRNQKTNISSLGTWGRRAVLRASQVLPSDERNHWLKLFTGNAPAPLEKWVAKWVIESF
jgi:Reverse transcriptase (RNA-dependent DNA polymerase)